MSEQRTQQQEGQALPVRREERAISRPEEWMESPISMIRRFHDEMDRMFESMFTGFGFPMMRPFMAAPSERIRATAPAVDVWETDEDVIVCADLPGVDPKNIEIYTTEDSLRMRAESRREEEQREKGFYRAERRYGRFERLIDLPASVKPGEAKATFKHGVLEVTLPKSEQAKERMKKVTVEAEEEQLAGVKGGQTSEQQQQRRRQQRKQQ